MTSRTRSPGKPLRRDAQRNVERIQAAAIEVFREQGLDASHEAIAQRADVSIGTVYRRFPDREQLIDLAFEDELDQVVAVAREALACEDPWDGFVHLLERSLELAAGSTGLNQLITGSRHGAERVERVRRRLEPLAVAVIDRAREAGALRHDAAPQDLPLTLMMLSAVVEAGRDVGPDAWRRYLAVLLDGLRADDRRATELPPPVPMDALDRVIERHHRR